MYQDLGLPKFLCSATTNTPSTRWLILYWPSPKRSTSDAMLCMSSTMAPLLAFGWRWRGRRGSRLSFRKTATRMKKVWEMYGPYSSLLEPTHF